MDIISRDFSYEFPDPLKDFGKVEFQSKAAYCDKKLFGLFICNKCIGNLVGSQNYLCWSPIDVASIAVKSKLLLKMTAIKEIRIAHQEEIEKRMTGFSKKLSTVATLVSIVMNDTFYVFDMLLEQYRVLKKVWINAKKIVPGEVKSVNFPEIEYEELCKHTFNCKMPEFKEKCINNAEYNLKFMSSPKFQNSIDIVIEDWVQFDNLRQRKVSHFAKTPPVPILGVKVPDRTSTVEIEQVVVDTDTEVVIQKRVNTFEVDHCNDLEIFTRQIYKEVNGKVEAEFQFYFRTIKSFMGIGIAKKIAKKSTEEIAEKLFDYYGENFDEGGGNEPSQPNSNNDNKKPDCPGNGPSDSNKISPALVYSVVGLIVANLLLVIYILLF
eukprot:TRINITY_DN9947_c0_g1_i1.p1 TRINITY_DN9947_c0_g1~~TRINITY_DN9947_c0_g1_i1.p1  ORF type:complete len:380 (-),score=105.19 TRINITY_DN9947_c0_g1_i1:92-1231(-)